MSNKTQLVDFELNLSKIIQVLNFFPIVSQSWPKRDLISELAYL